MIKGQIRLPGDKSIAHRSIILSSLAQGKTTILNFPLNKDCLTTLNALRKLGAKISINKNKVVVSAKGLFGLTCPEAAISVGNSGTTIRLLLGVLAGCDFKARLIAGKSLSRRPMRRVTLPLREMGAQISSKFKIQNSKPEEYPPITIRGGRLKAITYKLPVASAQVKSAILLAGLYAEGKTKVIESIPTRDHTERMLKLFKAGIKVNGNTKVITGRRQLVSPGKITIPGDISSAAFFIVLASILTGSRLILKNVSLNPSRTGIIRLLKKMGADVRISGYLDSQISATEPAGDILVKSSKLRGITVKRKEIPSVIDEIPILMVAACFAKTKTLLEGVGELRFKETDRIRSMVENLKKMGADITIAKSGICENILIRASALKGAKVKSYGDHRTAMSMLVASLATSGKTYIDDISCIDKSFPEFIKIITGLTKRAIPHS